MLCISARCPSDTRMASEHLLPAQGLTNGQRRKIKNEPAEKHHGSHLKLHAEPNPPLGSPQALWTPVTAGGQTHWGQQDCFETPAKKVFQVMCWELRAA